MKLFSHILTAIAFCIISISSSPLAPPVSGSRSALPVPLEDILRAHGEPGALAALNSYEIEMTKIVNTTSPHFFVQRVRLSVEGDKLKRLTTDSRSGRTRIELIDENGQFHAMGVNQGEPMRSSLLPPSEQRRIAVRNSVSACSLIPFLRAFSDESARAFYLGRGQGGADKYLVVASGRQYAICLDQNRLITRIEIGRATFEFTDFRLVGPLRLPFVERISIGDRPVFEFFFREYELDPVFGPDHFSRAAED